MATASSNVQVKVTYKGIDNVSKTSARATAGVRRFGKSAKDATKDARNFGKAFEESGDRISDTSGKASTALSSLGDFAGSSEGAFRSASEAAGLLDDIMTVLPGPIGIAAGAIAGLTTVLVLNRQEAARSAARIRQAFGPELAQEVSALRREFGFSAEAAVDLGRAIEQSGIPAEELAPKLRRVVENAEEIGEDGSQAVSDFAKTLIAAGKPVDRLVAKLRRLNLEASNRAFADLTATRKEGEEADKAAATALDNLTKKLSEQRRALRDLQAGRTGEFKRLSEQRNLLQSVGDFLTGNERRQRALSAAADRDAQSIADQVITQRKVLLFASFRGGSSFFGATFLMNPKTFYLFEPLKLAKTDRLTR